MTFYELINLNNAKGSETRFCKILKNISNLYIYTDGSNLSVLRTKFDNIVKSHILNHCEGESKPRAKRRGQRQSNPINTNRYPFRRFLCFPHDSLRNSPHHNDIFGDCYKAVKLEHGLKESS